MKVSSWIFVIFFLFCFTLTVKANNAYYNAQILANFSPEIVHEMSSNFDVIDSLMEKYHVETFEILNIDRFLQNPFDESGRPITLKRDMLIRFGALYKCYINNKIKEDKNNKREFYYLDSVFKKQKAEFDYYLSQKHNELKLKNDSAIAKVKSIDSINNLMEIYKQTKLTYELIKRNDTLKLIELRNKIKEAESSKQNQDNNIIVESLSSIISAKIEKEELLSDISLLTNDITNYQDSIKTIFDLINSSNSTLNSLLSDTSEINESIRKSVILLEETKSKKDKQDIVRDSILKGNISSGFAEMINDVNNYQNEVEAINREQTDNISKIELNLKEIQQQREESAKTEKTEPGGRNAEGVIIEGITRYLIKRFKDDATFIFMTNFRKQLNEIEDFKYLLPNTFAIFDIPKERGEESIDMQFVSNSLFDRWKKAFITDLKEAPRNIITFCDSSKLDFAKNVSKSKNYKYLKFGVDLSDKILSGYHMSELIEYADIQLKKDKNLGSLYDAVHGINIIQKNLIDESKHPNGRFSNIWLSFENLRKLDTPEEALYFAGLIFQQDRNYFKYYIKKLVGSKTLITFSISDYNKTVLELKKSISDNLNKLKEKAVEVLNNNRVDYDELKSDIEKIKSENNELTAKLNIQYASYKRYLNKIYLNFDNFIYNKLFPVYQIMIKLNELDKYEKNTNEAILNYMQLSYEMFCASKSIFKIKTEVCKDEALFFNIVQVYRAINQGNYLNIINQSLQFLKIIIEIDSNNKFNNYLTQVLKHAGFVESIANAQSSEEVENIISNYALPPGGFIIKRKSDFVLSVCAYPSFYAGIEQLYRENQKVGEQMNTGLTVPLGLDLMFCKSKNLSLFLYLFDFAAPINVGLYAKQDEDKYPKEFTIKQILSPGLMFTFGLNEFPLSFGLGYQYTPDIRKVKIGNEEVSANSNKLMLKLSWDLPILLLYKTEE